MKFHTEGSFKIKSGISRTFKSLSDPAFISFCIPDLQSSEIIDENHFNAKVKVGIGIVRGSVSMKFALVEKQEPSRAKLVADGSGAGSKIHLESTFGLREDSGTVVDWSADADLSGLMAGIGGPILKGQSEKMVNKIFENIKAKLES